MDECLLAVVVDDCFGSSPNYSTEAVRWGHVRRACEPRRSGEAYLMVTARCGAETAELLKRCCRYLEMKFGS